MSNKTSVHSASESASGSPAQTTSSTSPDGGSDRNDAAAIGRSTRIRPGDFIFRFMSTGSAVLIMIILAGVALLQNKLLRANESDLER